MDQTTGTFLAGPDFSTSLPRRRGEPVEMDHAAAWLTEPLPNAAAFVALDLRSEQSLHEMLGPRRTAEFIGAVAARIKEVRPNDVVFRLRDDVFLIAISDLPGEHAESFARAFRDAVGEPTEIAGTPTAVSFGVTIAVACRAEESSPSQLLDTVEEALAEANASNRPLVIASSRKDGDT
jgi:GGDEF domain-containing protein